MSRVYMLIHAFAHICARTCRCAAHLFAAGCGWMFGCRRLFNISMQNLCWIPNDGSDESKDDTTCGPMQ